MSGMGTAGATGNVGFLMGALSRRAVTQLGAAPYGSVCGNAHRGDEHERGDSVPRHIVAPRPAHCLNLAPLTCVHFMFPLVACSGIVATS
jgi:hypothetical protein